MKRTGGNQKIDIVLDSTGLKVFGEGEMYCFKTAFGDRLQNRLLATQAVEVGIKCNILNQFQQLGRPDSYAED